MPTTSNFGWTTPADTDLVKDGAAAIRTLGNGIDTSLVDLKGGTTGQILSKNSNTDLDYTWINNDQGDITEVQAGTGISVASGTGPVPVITNTVATTFDAKGDLVVGTGADTFAKLVAGSNGDTVVADSSTTTGLRWQADWNTGKNKIINGDFGINQRAFSSTTTDGTYGFDRWQMATVGGTTYSAQTFTAGTAPVAGYEAINFARMVTTSQNATTALSILKQKIEDVRTFANQTATISFWAKAGSGTPKVAVEFQQNFGSGGSSDVNTYAGQATLSTSWTRYSLTVSVPSISGKTIGTSSRLDIAFWTSAGTNYNSRTGSLGAQDTTIDLWGVQVEAGSVATPFTTATGTLAGELAACQRYYWRHKAENTTNPFGTGYAYSTTKARIFVPFPVTMRIAPTALEQSGTASDYRLQMSDGGAANGTSVVIFMASSLYTGNVEFTSVGMTTGPAIMIPNSGANAYLGWSAEL